MEQATQISRCSGYKDQHIHAQAMVTKLRAKYCRQSPRQVHSLWRWGLRAVFGRLVMLCARGGRLVLLGVFLALYDGFIGPVFSNAKPRGNITKKRTTFRDCWRLQRRQGQNQQRPDTGNPDFKGYRLDLRPCRLSECRSGGIEYLRAKTPAVAEQAELLRGILAHAPPPNK